MAMEKKAWSGLEERPAAMASKHAAAKKNLAKGKNDNLPKYRDKIQKATMAHKPAYRAKRNQRPAPGSKKYSAAPTRAIPVKNWISRSDSPVCPANRWALNVSSKSAFSPVNQREKGRNPGLGWCGIYIVHAQVRTRGRSKWRHVVIRFDA